MNFFKRLAAWFLGRKDVDPGGGASPAPVPAPAVTLSAEAISQTVFADNDFSAPPVSSGAVFSASAEAFDESSEDIFMNREISWLKFNDRVLEEAERESNPLGERLSFASIYQTNLDEFFMVRVGTLMDQLQETPEMVDSRSRMTPAQQLSKVLTKVHKVIPRRDAVYAKLMAELEKEGFFLVDFHQINDQNVAAMERFFDREVAPFMEPNVIRRKAPFPFLKNTILYVVAVLISKTGKERLGIIPCDTGVFPRLVEVADAGYMLSEELILHFVPKIFKGYRIKAKSLIRVTRSADIDADELYDEELDYRDFMSEIIRRRKRLRPVRLEMSRQLDEGIVALLCSYLELDPSQAFYSREPLDLSFVFTIRDRFRQKKHLFFPPRIPRWPQDLNPKVPMMKQIRERDRLLLFPYESINPFLELLHEAARDEHVKSIKITLYRVAAHSKIIDALIEARENGKDVQVLMELKARFDEENNIAWSRRLEHAGCRVVYGIPGFKIHSKLCLITREEGGMREYFTQIGTGNYNERTARLYTDICFLTTNPAVGIETASFFEGLMENRLDTPASLLVSAPKHLKKTLLYLIREETRKAAEGKAAYIGLKVNSLSDIQLMQALIRASQAGVRVEMVVRGICCLLPGVKGRTDNIRITSIVGRFLEHSRIYIFGQPAGDDPAAVQVFISSADLMTRNMEKRFEVAVPLQDPSLKRQILAHFNTLLKDNTNARVLTPSGKYSKPCIDPGHPEAFCAQEELLRSN